MSVARFPLAVPSAADAARSADLIRRQLDDYIIPRIDRIDAPLLVVVGGSTGAGKSTLVNSIAGTEVSAPGVLRPTTRSAVLVCHPDDAAAFRERRILPGLARTDIDLGTPDSLRVSTSPSLDPGLALLDAPDIDSVVDANRELAGQLLAAADLWLFVTTAARYADAVPWSVLQTAQHRGTVVALVLDRVPPGAEADVSAHLREMLAERDLGDTMLFVVSETRLTGSGLLPDSLIAPLRTWLAQLAGDAVARAAVIRTTLEGALRGVVVDVAALAEASDEQTRTWSALELRARAAYDQAYQNIDHGVGDGALLRGEVLARWQEFVGTGDLMRTLQSRVGQLRDIVTSAITGRPRAGGDLREALTTGLAALIQANMAEAAERAAAAWRDSPAGAALITDMLQRPGADLDARVGLLIREWQRGVIDMVREHGAEKRNLARISAYAVNAAGLVVMIAVFASTAFIPTGAEVGVAAGTTLAAQKLLEALFGDDALRQLSRLAREDLLLRVRGLTDEEAGRFAAVGTSMHLQPQQASALRRAADAVANLIPQAKTR
jgi:energy-coupling factor transporter ATP-binding protein EcfA2